MTQHNRLLRWVWYWHKNTKGERVRAFQVYMPGPEGTRHNGKLLMIRTKHPDRLNLKAQMALLQRQLGTEVLRRFAGVD